MSNLLDFLHRDKNQYYCMFYVDGIVLNHINSWNDGMVSVYKADQIRMIQIQFVYMEEILTKTGGIMIVVWAVFNLIMIPFVRRDWMKQVRKSVGSDDETEIRERLSFGGLYVLHEDVKNIGNTQLATILCQTEIKNEYEKSLQSLN